VTLGYVQVDPEIAKLVEAAGQALAGAGAIVEQRDPGFANPFDTFKTHWYTGAANLLRSIPVEKHRDLEPGLLAIAGEGEQIPHMDYIAATNARGALGQHMSMFHSSYDVLLTPTLPIPAFEVNRIAPAGTDQSNWMHWTPFSYPFNLTQQPAASIPCGFTASGLPVGLQIVAAKYRDDLVLRVARAYETLNPIKTPFPTRPKGGSSWSRYPNDVGLPHATNQRAPEARSGASAASPGAVGAGSIFL